MWIVPAKVAGTWRLPDGELTLQQEFQMVKGTLSSSGTPASVDGRLRGTEISFKAGSAEYTGTVNGEVMEGRVKTGGAERTWRATRSR
jgi:hypothetical protein